MQPARTDLASPKNDPFTTTELAQYDGSDPSKPIYVAIKGDIFDVTHKADSYGPGKSYNIFAGKDGSRGLGKSSLKIEDAVADYSTLSTEEQKVLDDWHSFFSYVVFFLPFHFSMETRSLLSLFCFSSSSSGNDTISLEGFLMVQRSSHRRQM
ncbi:hypothetical protein Ac2012v2_002216 [Leucoagaricus gongylophorus]